MTVVLNKKWRTGARLAQRLNAEFRIGSGYPMRATRPALEVERYLVICRKCPHFAGDDCSQVAIRPEIPNYVELLTREEHFCQRWKDGPV